MSIHLSRILFFTLYKYKSNNTVHYDRLFLLCNRRIISTALPPKSKNTSSEPPIVSAKSANQLEVFATTSNKSKALTIYYGSYGQ